MLEHSSRRMRPAVTLANDQGDANREYVENLEHALDRALVSYHVHR